MKKRSLQFGLLMLFPVFFLSCQKVFDYSPYEAKVPDKVKNTTTMQLNTIAKLSNGAENYKIALISDNHYHYDDLNAAIKALNTRSDIQFIMVLGDLADQGQLEEFMQFHDVMDKSVHPYVTVIGNHDYLSNGEKVYDQMFGARNYTFEFNDLRFIMFDDVFLESNTVPDFNWLQTQLDNNPKQARTIVCAHIPPFDEQFSDVRETQYSTMLREAGVSMSWNGHIHTYSFQPHYNDGLNYLVVPSVNNRAYCEISITSHDIQASQIPF